MRVLAMIAALFFSPMLVSGEIYKWKDENGKVHYGDQKSAPVDGAKTKIGQEENRISVPISVKLERLKEAERIRASNPGAPVQSPMPEVPDYDLVETADPKLVGSSCKGIVEKIEAASERKEPWKELAAQFEADCPRVAYVCRKYRKRPQDNNCRWVKRESGKSIMQTKVTD